MQQSRLNATLRQKVDEHKALNEKYQESMDKFINFDFRGPHSLVNMASLRLYKTSQPHLKSSEALLKRISENGKIEVLQQLVDNGVDLDPNHI